METTRTCGMGRPGRTAGLFLALAAVMGALQWNWFAMPLERDEGEYAYAAWLMRTGKGLPYKDSFLQKPPMIVYTYGLVEALAPESDKVGFRVAGFLAALATAGLLWGIGRHESGGRAGVWAAWLWVVFLQQMTMFNSVAANVEKFMVVPMLGAMVAVGAGERRPWRWALAGAAAGMAVLYKPICVPVLGVYFLWKGWGRTSVEWRRAWRWWGAAALGGVAVVAAGVAWFACKGALGSMWECAISYTGIYARLMGHPWQTGMEFLGTAAHWKAWVILCLAVAGFCGRARSGWGWLAVLAAAWGVAMSDANGHYYVMALPVAALGAGAAIERWAVQAGRWSGWLGAAGVAAVYAAMMTGNEGWAPRLTPVQLSMGVYAGNPFAEAEGAGKIVAAACGEDETVHIVGSEPEIMWYARRKGTTRFDIAYPMTLPTVCAAGYQAEAMAALRKNTPDVIVCVRTWLGFLGSPEVCGGYLQAMAGMTLDGGYRLVWSYVPGKGGWVAGGDWAAHERDGATMGIWTRVDGGNVDRNASPQGGSGTADVVAVRDGLAIEG